MKYKFFQKSVYALMLFISIGCTDELEIISEDDVSPEIALSNPTTIEGVVLGLYSQAQAADAFNGTPQTASEWQADNASFKGSFPTFRQIFTYSTQADNTSIDNIWFQNVDVIEACNFLINNLPPVELNDLPEETKNQFLGEARFMRALTMFNMSIYFGQPFNIGNGSSLSIPIILDDFNGDTTPFLIPRNTLNEVYDQIDTDLTFAINNLPDSYSANADTRGRATSGAATALLARLELYRENFTVAAQLATQVIESPVYTLATDYSFYNGLTSEDVFSIINIAIDSQNSNEGFGGLTNPTPEGRGDAPFSANLVAAYAEEEGDLRYSELTQTGVDAEGVTSVFTTKFDDGVTNADNAPIIRITEMYLIRAEANVRGGTTIGASPLSDINTLRDRASLDPVSVVDIDRVLIERRKELAFEGGHRRIDLLRNGRSLRRAGQDNVSDSNAGDDLTIFPIPTRERDLNPDLEQNPGY
ncbi:putative outer membrane starch-binding protein [Leeuwenhoekiella aestuarii]|uniref:Putative outer membrane starch-binding protein n=1 Tax=Leeuwenhoekiella aestuarii TaxID=2249426 RepID=A0A4Q0NQ44_9FLAO|nr:RagB/SusD family nutrient uptake outer membrane protein [Leeuwenhoekiella aestuarii]RXG11348.1 putative outer membrane starch-binding protein [Leeuwenhoekiella aestuarii]RXG11771.1 putative outer membrane starch-binding protein [Leeuwenhoekiella aestuarii]